MKTKDIPVVDLSPEAKIKIIEVYQGRVRTLEEEQNRLFENACQQLQIDLNQEPEATILFDSLYNATWTPEVTMRRIWPADTAAVK